jgi:hypothetical protein
VSTEETERIRQLRAMLADLDGYVQRRAEDLAEPMIRDAEARARLAVVEARGEVQRQTDLVAELRKRIEAQGRRLSELEECRGRLAAALSRPAGTPWLAIVSLTERRLRASDLAGPSATEEI